jgi:16S rRNA (guanine527-N7)-methyltransferase
MKPDRIAELLEPFLASSTLSSEPCHSEARSTRESAVLTATQLQNISTYIDMLQRWNARINLTAIRDEEQIVTRHFGESLFAARHLFPLSSAVPSVVKGLEVADVGSGAGFPGIPIKLWAPEISLTLIESNQKKATFLKEVARALTLTDVNIQTARAESLASASFAVVTLRAVERFESILPVAANLVVPGGCLALLISQTQLPQAQSALRALDWSDPIAIPASQSRVFTLVRKR